jgi:hypothetical protein
MLGWGMKAFLLVFCVVGLSCLTRPMRDLTISSRVAGAAVTFFFLD